jgi:PAS domain S-box-containing protein
MDPFGSERDVRAALAAAGLGLWESLLPERVLRWSDQTRLMLGYMPGELDGITLSWKAVLHPDDFDRAAESFRRHVQEEGRHAVDCRVMRADGDYQWVSVSGCLVERAADGEPRRVIGLIQDITHRKALETQLLQSQKVEALGRLASGIAHDVNNLLGVVLGRCNLLLEPQALETLEPRSRFHVEEIVRAVSQGANLTRQILAFSRRQMVAREVLALDERVVSMRAMLETLLGEDKHLELDLAGPDLHVDVASGQIDQIVFNLVANAREALASHGRVRIATKPVALGTTAATELGVAPGAFACLVVEDDGRGMTPDVAERIFEPFFTTKELGQGTGLGLSVVQGIVSQTGGAIRVETAPGQGARFTIWLPLATPARERAWAAAAESQQGRVGAIPRSCGPSEGPRNAAAPAAPGRERAKILLVEDERLIRELISEYLEGCGYEVLAAEQPRRVIDMLEAGELERVDLVISDVLLPGMTGTDLVQILRRRIPQARLLLMSGFPGHLPIDQLQLDAGTPFLEKPFTMDALVALVRRVLAAER